MQKLQFAFAFSVAVAFGYYFLIRAAIVRAIFLVLLGVLFRSKIHLRFVIESKTKPKYSTKISSAAHIDSWIYTNMRSKTHTQSNNHRHRHTLAHLHTCTLAHIQSIKRERNEILPNEKNLTVVVGFVSLCFVHVFQ